MDNRTVAYVLDAQPVFEDLRQVAAQLSGLLVLAATGSKEASPDHPMLLASKQVLTHACDGVRRTAALVSEPARAHYTGLVDAANALKGALACAEAWPLDVEAVLIPLRHAYSCLQRAAAALPGFQMVAFDQGCCGLPLRSQ